MNIELADHTNVLFYLARHGRTDLNAANCFRGTANPHLDSVGIKQAHTLAKLLEHVELCGIFCSDKLRAVHTADIIGKDNGVPIHQTSQLRALNVGKFSGQKKTPENEAVVQDCVNHPDTPIPGGESFSQFRGRIHPCFEEAICIAQHHGMPVLIVAHSSIVREAGQWLYGNHKAVLVEPGGLAVVYLKDGKLAADAIFKPISSSDPKASTIS